MITASIIAYILLFIIFTLVNGKTQIVVSTTSAIDILYTDCIEAPVKGFILELKIDDLSLVNSLKYVQKHI